MLIGKLSKESGFSRDTIRYYEKLGLIRADESIRQQNNYKNYSPRSLEDLAHIAQLKTLGFTLAEISNLLKSIQSDDLACVDLPAKLSEKVALFEKKVALLEQYIQKLKAVELACNGACDDESGLPNCFVAVE